MSAFYPLGSFALMDQRFIHPIGFAARPIFCGNYDTPCVPGDNAPFFWIPP
ncbi:MAG TPA: hypothetical protein VK249_08915 [Anaerolineales bacterium]|nr:hypothetical protein [Anaerolineales bacterium]